MVAHRGANRLRTENTLEAFAAALDQGAGAIELDVHATSDRVVIVHHDADLMDRGAATTGRIQLAAQSWQQVKAMRLPGGESIPRLSDVLSLVGDRARVYVEIKGHGIERAVVDTIRGGRAEYAVHSFDHAAIGRVRAIAPDIPRGLLLDKGDPVRDVIALIERFGARDLWPHHAIVTKDLVDDVHRAGARVVAWTVNDAVQARTLVALGVDAVCTDDVPHVASALASRHA
jgi:glycerophosphoryl diester phosphodiesterase